MCQKWSVLKLNKTRNEDNKTNTKTNFQKHGKGKPIPEGKQTIFSKDFNKRTTSGKFNQ